MYPMLLPCFFLLSMDQSTASVGAQVTARRHPPFRRIRLHACLVLEGLCQCIPCGSAAFFEAPFEPHDSHCKTVWTFVFSINLSNAKSFNPWMVVDSLVTGRWVERFLLVRFSRCYSLPSLEQAPGTFDDFDGPCTSSFWRWQVWQVTDERMCSLESPRCMFFQLGDWSTWTSGAISGTHPLHFLDLLNILNLCLSSPSMANYDQSSDLVSHFHFQINS